jgi:hypothetical protein
MNNRTADLDTPSPTRIEQGDIDAFTQSLRTQGTPWALGCEALILCLWQEARAARATSPCVVESSVLKSARALSNSTWTPASDAEGCALIFARELVRLHERNG